MQPFCMFTEIKDGNGYRQNSAFLSPAPVEYINRFIISTFVGHNTRSVVRLNNLIAKYNGQDSISNIYALRADKVGIPNIDPFGSRHGGHLIYC